MLFQKGQQFSAERGNVVLLNIETGARKLRQAGQKILQRQEIFPVLLIDQAIPPLRRIPLGGAEFEELLAILKDNPVLIDLNGSGERIFCHRRRHKLCM